MKSVTILGAGVSGKAAAKLCAVFAYGVIPRYVREVPASVKLNGIPHMLYGFAVVIGCRAVNEYAFDACLFKQKLECPCVA